MSNRVECITEDNGDIESCTLSLTDAQENTIHIVPSAQNKKTIQGLKQWTGECFFPDDPLHQFKQQKTIFNKIFLACQCMFPVMIWGSDYSLKLLKSDVISGLTIASLAIPQGISYAKLANLPPVYGLYSSFVPPLIYLILGSSRELAVGPSSIVSVILGSMLLEETSPVEQPLLYLQLALTATFYAGAFQALLGILRLGFIVEFLSKPTLAGFTGGAAVITVLQQLKGLTGIHHFTQKTGFLPVMKSIFQHLSEWNLNTMLMGFAFLAFLLFARKISVLRPKLFLISATAPLVSVIVSTIIMYSFRLQIHDIQTVGQLPEGMNPPSINMLLFKGSHSMLVIKVGIICGILSLTEGIAVGRTFASQKDYQIDGNKEMMAIGIMNIAGSLTSSFVTTGSFSRSAVNYNSGCKTAVSNLVMAFVVLVTIMFLMPLFYYTPNVVLSVTIIIAVIGLIDYRVPLRLWKIDKIDFIAYLSAFIGVLFISVPIGLAIAVGISVCKILLPVTRPSIVNMGNVLGTQSYRSLGQYKDAIRVPYILILSIQFPVYFASAVYLQERILRWVRDEEERTEKMKENRLKYVVLDMSAVTAIDISGIDALLEVKKALNHRSLQIVLANPIGEVANKLFISNAWEEFGSNNIYMNVAEAITDVTRLIKNQNEK